MVAKNNYIDTISNLIKKNVDKKAIVDIVENVLQPYLIIDKNFIVNVCFLLKNDINIKLDFLSCLTGVDRRPLENKFEIVYHLSSTANNILVTLKVQEGIKDKDFDISFNSVSSIWKSADWYEREIFDLFGVSFINHPNLKRILLPDDWEGYPLRKDYEAAKLWHNIPIEYDREEDL